MKIRMFQQDAQQIVGKFLYGGIGNGQYRQIPCQKGYAFIVEQGDCVYTVLVQVQVRRFLRQNSLFVKIIAQIAQYCLDDAVVKHKAIITDWGREFAFNLEVVAVQVFPFRFIEYCKVGSGE